MPGELARPDAAAARLTPAQIAEFVELPLKQVPAEWRPEVWDFWAYHSLLMPTQLALATRLRHWIDDGLTLADARSVFAALTDPGEAQFRFGSDLLAELAARVGVVLARRRKLADQLARRDRDATADAEAARITARLADNFKP